MSPSLNANVPIRKKILPPTKKKTRQTKEKDIVTVYNRSIVGLLEMCYATDACLELTVESEQTYRETDPNSRLHSVGSGLKEDGAKCTKDTI